MRPIYTATTLEGSPTWGIPDEALDRFFTELWSLLTAETGLLAEATLRGFNKRPLPNTSGARQIDADLLMLESHKGVYRCDVCRRPHARQTPRRVCTALRCSGHLELEREDPDDFDLVLLDRRYAMVRAREHSAQIPADDCELLERTFKGEGERVNTLVRTPTLELGVDIGGLDAVLMRNVPPLPANLLAASRASRTPSSHGGGFDLCSHPCA